MVSVAPSTAYLQAHRDASMTSVQDIASSLQEILSRKLTAYIVGVRNAKTVSRWATGEVMEIRDTQMEQRLRTAFEIVQLMLPYESPQTIRAWFIGLNPQMDDKAPAEAIADGQLREALNAARAFLAGS